MLVLAVTWRDSVHPAGKWEAAEDVKPYVSIVVSVGIIVHEDEESTVIVPTWSKDAHGFLVNGAHTIPTQAIMDKTLLAEFSDE